jgi:glycerol-3-phosphate responsive antiterminator
MELFRHYLTSVKSRSSLIPTILSKEKIFDVVEAFSGILPESIEQIQEGDFSQVLLYGIAEEKKHFDIATVRKLIQDMSLKPYE